MINPEAHQCLERALQALVNQNFSVAERLLTDAIEYWPDHCDLHRALAYTSAIRADAPTPPDTIKAIHDTISSFDEMVPTIGGDTEETFSTYWQLPLIAVQPSLHTRGQVRAAYAASLVEAGRYDEARAELDRARNERIGNPKLQSETVKTIAAVECLLYYRTSRWDDLIKAAGPMCTINSTEPVEQTFAALGNSFAGSGLDHIGSHIAAQDKLRYAITIETNNSDIPAWASLQLGLSLRVSGDEDAAQKALSNGMQFSTKPELSEAMRDKNIKVRVSAPDVIAARTSYWDVTTEPDVAEYMRQASQEDRREVLTEALAKLDAIDGMDEVKGQIRRLRIQIIRDNEKRRRGIPVEAKTRHLVFKGPPGTGKTTIANLICDLYYGLGVTRLRNMVPVNRAKLIGSYEGESAKKTLAALESARGGTMFLDEAYELVQDRPGQSDPYGSEALTTMLEYMDNHRDDLVLIIAGYEGPIERFLGENPGLKSRFSGSISFVTYNGDEMWRIINGMADKAGTPIDQSVEDRFKQIIEIMWDTDQNGDRVLDVAGNGRFARNVFQQADDHAGQRMENAGVDLEHLSGDDFATLTTEDVLGAMSNILKGFGINVASIINAA